VSLPPLTIRIFLILLVLIASFFDIRERRIPNWLTIAGVPIAIALNAFHLNGPRFEIEGLWYSLKGLGLAFAVYFGLYLLRGMGAGDVKLMAAVGAATGPYNWLGILFLTALLGGVAAFVLAVSKGRMRRTFLNMWLLVLSLRQGRAPYRDNPELDVRNEMALRLPHGVVIAGGTLAFLAAALIWAPR
jgi:prepilin peptidase CpaA